MNAVWRPVYVLPNLQLRPPDEASNYGSYDLAAGGITLGSDCVAIVPPEDPRVQDARQRMRGLEQMLTGFTDEHGTRMRPAVLLVRDPHPRGVTLDALRAFRNVAALATVLRARVMALPNPDHHLSPRWADTFDFYPAQVDAVGELSFGSAAVWTFGGHPGRLVATTAPYIDVRSQPLLADHFLHRALGTAWRGRFQRGRAHGDREGRLLFRSLETAYAAASVPIRNLGSLQDYGARIGEWVSALEMLVRGDGARAGEANVAALLGRAPWYVRLRWVRSRNQTIAWRKDDGTVKRRERVTPAVRLLRPLYQARHDFLHGNDVHWRTLSRIGRRRVERGVSLLAAGAVLYQVALWAWLAQRYAFPLDDDGADAIIAMGDQMASARALRILLRGAVADGEAHEEDEAADDESVEDHGWGATAGASDASG